MKKITSIPVLAIVILSVLASVSGDRVLIVVPSDISEEASALTGMTLDIGLSATGEEPATFYWAEVKASGIDTARVRFVCDSLESYYFELSPLFTNNDALDSLNLRRLE